MRMKTMSRRLTAFLLSVFMLLTCMPMGVLAEGEITDTVTVEVIPEAEETAPAAETEAAGAETVTEETPSPQTDSTPQEETADEPLDETTEEHEAEQVQTKAPAEPAQAPDEGHESESTEAAVTDASETALSPETMEPAAEAPAEVSLRQPIQVPLQSQMPRCPPRLLKLKRLPSWSRQITAHRCRQRLRITATSMRRRMDRPRSSAPLP